MLERLAATDALCEQTVWWGVLHLQWRFYVTEEEPAPYPYPDFLQVVCMADAVAHDPNAITSDGWETGSGLLPIDDALRVIDDDQQAILRAALAARG